MRPLPKGLELCPTCGEARGTATRRGSYSACLCEGARCSWCTRMIRQPISDYYDHRVGRWIHVPYFGNQAHVFNCPARATGARPHRWERGQPSAELTASRDAVTRATWAEIVERAKARLRKRAGG